MDKVDADAEKGVRSRRNGTRTDDLASLIALFLPVTPSIIGTFFDFVDPLAWITTGLPHIFGRAAPGGHDVIRHVMDYFWPTNRT